MLPSVLCTRYHRRLPGPRFAYPVEVLREVAMAHRVCLASETITTTVLR